MLTIRRWTARVTLALLVVAALWALWGSRMGVVSALWPFYSGHHPRILVFVGGIVLWIVAGAVIVYVVATVLLLLWKEARR